MLISYHWLSELTGTILTPAELRESLTMVGLAIDSVEEQNDDQILDVEVPSNRPDCLSHIGIAREVAVIESGNLHEPVIGAIPTSGKAEEATAVQIIDSDLCPRYTARVVRGVKIGPSPDWLALRLTAIGQRPINNVADITNYVLHEMGQPLHAFDLAKLDEYRIVVRRAAQGETLKTLDGVERKLTSDMLVIADARRAVALAGVMGGEESEISNQTTDVLVESAYFNPDSVRRTARALGMDTEASRRFERGVDFDGVLRAQERCVQLICEIAGGVATENAIDACVETPAQRIIDFHFARVKSLTSLVVAVPEMLRVLRGLGFKSIEERTESAKFIVPSWRVDVEQEEDLVEEVARHTGFNLIGSELPPALSAGEYQPHELQRRSLRRALAANGYDEAINFSFIESSAGEQIEPVSNFIDDKLQESFITLRNPIIEEAVRMRQTLLPGLLESLRHNLNHGQRDVRLFEIGRIFAGRGSKELPDEHESLALVASGGLTEESRAQSSHDIDFYDLKGGLEAGIDAMKCGPLVFRSASLKHLREGQAASIMLDGRQVGSIGRLAEATAAAYKFRQPVFVAEVDLTSVLASAERAISYAPLARFPSVVRDVTLLVNREVGFADMAQTVANEKLSDCRQVQFVGVYEGPNIPEGLRAITLRFQYRSDERTLRDQDVESMHDQLVNALIKTFKAQRH